MGEDTHWDARARGTVAMRAGDAQHKVSFGRTVTLQLDGGVACNWTVVKLAIGRTVGLQLDDGIALAIPSLCRETLAGGIV